MAGYVKEPRYCADCRLFRNMDPEGEGVCGFDGCETWHGEIGCERFEKKEDEDDE